MMIGVYVHGFISSLILVIFPLASELESDPARLERLYLKAMKIVCGLVVFMVLTLIVTRNVFLEAYMGAEFARLSSEFLILHTISFGATAILAVAWQMNEGLGNPRMNFRIFVVCAALCLPLMVLLIEPFGARGVAIARLVGFGTMFFAIFFVEKKVFGGVRTAFWLRTAGMLTLAAVAAAVVETLLVDRLSAGWMAIALTVIAGAASYAAALWAVGFISEDERVLVRTLFNRRNA